MEMFFVIFNIGQSKYHTFSINSSTTVDVFDTKIGWFTHDIVIFDCVFACFIFLFVCLFCIFFSLS